MNALYSELQWLPRAPKDFTVRLKALGNSAGPLGSELQALASHALDLNQLTKLAKVIDQARSGGKRLDPLTPFRLAVLSNSTIG
ncbi:MAG: haloacid dehalogenase, partial [Terracidiphilus sp.]